jgi:glycosyltransferase involved in cell wall biosynthesis
MRLLVLSVTNPVPTNNGVKMRTWSILRALAAERHEIVLVAFAEPREEDRPSSELSRVCRRVIQVPHRLKSLSSSKDYLGRATHLFSRTPYGVVAARSSEMASEIVALLNKKAVDVILCEQTDLLINLPAQLPVPLVVDFHNVDYLIMERYLRFERNLPKRLYAWLESRKLRGWERRACRLSSTAFACSDHDRTLLQALGPNLPMFVVPNVVDVNEYTPDGREDARKVLFQGGMDWYPNRDAVEFFVTQIFSRILSQVPDVKFVVAGRNPPEGFRQRLSQVPGVEFTGTVPDMRAEIASATVCVVPLRMGSGTRLKILEAAAMAKPIVSTHLGAEGLKFLKGKEIILEDDPATFASAVVRLIAAPFERRLLGQAARKRTEQDYSFPALRASLREALNTFTRDANLAQSSSVRETLGGSCGATEFTSRSYGIHE